MNTDKNGIPYFDSEDLMSIMYSGNIDMCHNVQCIPTKDIIKFNELADLHGFQKLNEYTQIDIDQKNFDEICQNEWLMPDEYKNINIIEYFSQLSATDDEKTRIFEELVVFEEKGLFPLLRYMIYLVDFMRENNIVWGVGRGSSVSSYVLFRIGVHRVNPMKHGLDWREFLR